VARLAHAQRWIRGLRPRASYARVFFEHTRWIAELFGLGGAQIIQCDFVKQIIHPAAGETFRPIRETTPPPSQPPRASQLRRAILPITW
jgi:hypothetical protein